jgi:hypothetical protein
MLAVQGAMITEQAVQSADRIDKSGEIKTLDGMEWGIERDSLN